MIRQACTKTKFATEEAAKYTLGRIARKSKRQKRPVRAYKCDRCRLWHLTSLPDIMAICEENKALKKQIEELKAQVSRLNQEMMKRVVPENEAFRKQIMRENMCLQLNKQIAAAGERNKKLRNDNRVLMQSIIELQNKIEELTRDKNCEAKSD